MRLKSLLKHSDLCIQNREHVCSHITQPGSGGGRCVRSSLLTGGPRREAILENVLRHLLRFYNFERNTALVKGAGWTAPEMKVESALLPLGYPHIVTVSFYTRCRGESLYWLGFTAAIHHVTSLWTAALFFVGEGCNCHSNFVELSVSWKYYGQGAQTLTSPPVRVPQLEDHTHSALMGALLSTAIHARFDGGRSGTGSWDTPGSFCLGLHAGGYYYFKPHLLPCTVPKENLQPQPKVQTMVAFGL